MSNFLRRNGFELIFKGRYKRTENSESTSLGRWKAKLLENKSDKITGFAKFTRSEGTIPYDYGMVFVDTNQNRIYDNGSNGSEIYDRRIPTSYRNLDRTKEMVNVEKAKFEIWFGEKAMIPYLEEYEDGYYKIKITDKKSGEYYTYDSYKQGFEDIIAESFGINLA